MADDITGLDARAAEQIQRRRHILLVNSDPALFDVARVLLADERYNVTSTNAVPLTFALIAAARPALVIIDLAVSARHSWDLLVRLNAAARTAAIPVIVTARDARLLAHAERYPDLYGGDIKMVVPFTTDTLLDAVRGLIGTA